MIAEMLIKVIVEFGCSTPLNLLVSSSVCSTDDFVADFIF
jgi:hypothetical protein